MQNKSRSSRPRLIISSKSLLFSGDDYITAFGAPDDDTRATISISAEAKHKLDKIQSRTGKSQIQIVEELILKEHSEKYQ